MPRFIIEIDENEIIKKVTRDGVEYGEAFEIEQLFSIPSIYFMSSAKNIELIGKEEEQKLRRALGIQSFLNSMIGVEAFCNTFFYFIGMKNNNNKIINSVKKTNGPLYAKLDELIHMTFNRSIVDQDIIIQKIRQMSKLRNEIVHPKWDPVTIEIKGKSQFIIEGMTENIQKIFEDELFCRESSLWCLLLVARIGEVFTNSYNIGGFMFHWTGIKRDSAEEIVGELEGII